MVIKDMEKMNTDKSWITVRHKDGFEQLIFLRDIPPYCFAFNDKIKKISIDSYATEIGRYAFYGCAELEEIVVNVETLDIDEYAFAYCPKLKTLKFNYGRKSDRFLSVNDMAFLGCGLIKQRFSDQTVRLNAAKIKQNSSFSDMHIQAVTKILRGMAEAGGKAAFSVDLQGKEFLKASNNIVIMPLDNGKFYLTDDGNIFRDIYSNPNLEIGWVKDYVDTISKDKKYFFKYGRIVSWCKDIDFAADALIEMCRAIELMGDLSCYLKCIECYEDMSEITDEEIDDALYELIQAHDNLSRRQAIDILSNKIEESKNGEISLRGVMKIAYMHAKVKKMAAKEFNNYRDNVPSAECEPAIRAKVDKLTQLLKDYTFDYEREDDVFENICMDLIEDIVGLAPEQNRFDAIKIAQTVLEIFRDKNADKKELTVLERVLKEFVIATDDEYNNLRRQIFEG